MKPSDWKKRIAKLPKGLSVRQAAARLLLPYQSVRAWLYRCGYKPIDGRRVWSAARRKAARKL